VSGFPLFARSTPTAAGIRARQSYNSRPPLGGHLLLPEEFCAYSGATGHPFRSVRPPSTLPPHLDGRADAPLSGKLNSTKQINIISSVSARGGRVVRSGWPTYVGMSGRLGPEYTVLRSSYAKPCSNAFNKFIEVHYCWPLDFWIFLPETLRNYQLYPRVSHFPELAL
jgi:hypothetical protein